MATELNLENIDTSFNAKIFVSLNQFRNIFQFSSDTSNIQIDKQNNNISYKTNISYLDNSSNLNPLNALIQFDFEKYNSLPNNHKCVRHDFIRSMANDIFGTSKAVDFFENEVELLDNLTNIGLQINNNLIIDISNANGLDETNNSNENIVKLLIDQMYEQAPGRFDICNNEYEYVMQDTQNYQPVPFNENDIISFKININPIDQLVLSQLSKPKNKIYKIQLHLTSQVNNGIGFDNSIPDDFNSIYNDNQYFYSYKEN